MMEKKYALSKLPQEEQRRIAKQVAELARQKGIRLNPTLEQKKQQELNKTTLIRSSSFLEGSGQTAFAMYITAIDYSVQEEKAVAYFQATPCTDAWEQAESQMGANIVFMSVGCASMGVSPAGAVCWLAVAGYYYAQSVANDQAWLSCIF